MNKHSVSQGGFVMMATILIGLVLSIFPLPEWATPFRPPWVSLIIIYWTMAVPHKFGIFYAWLAGLSVDIVTGGLMGQHALTSSVVVFLVLQLHLRLRLFPKWQQSVAVFILLCVESFLNLWITSIAYAPQFSWSFWYPMLVGMFLWFWVYFILRDIRRRFCVN